MKAFWKSQARYLDQVTNVHNEINAYIYLEQLMLFPIDIQDKIIEDISHLNYCNGELVANIISDYSLK
jgi:hypothetical protein